MVREPERLRELLRKVQNLMNDPMAPAGERDAAQVKLEALLEKYNMTIEDIVMEKKLRFTVQTATDPELWLIKQIWAYVTGSKKYSFWHRKGNRRLSFEATESQEREIREIFKFLRPIYKEEYEKFLEEFKSAFANKYQIAIPTEASETEVEWTVEDLARYKRIQLLREGMKETLLPTSKKLRLEAVNE